MQTDSPQRGRQNEALPRGGPSSPRTSTREGPLATENALPERRAGPYRPHTARRVQPRRKTREGDNMKLAEALQERADLNRRIEQLKDRLCSNALVQEGEQPVEDPGMLKQELDEAVARLSTLIARINLTNCATMADGQTLTELIAKKDALLLKLHVYRDVVYAGSQTAYRARNTEIRIQPAVSVPAWQAEVDRMAKEVRELDNKLQQSNWTTELTE